MSTLIVAIILIGVVILICFLFLNIHKKQKRKEMNQLLQEFSHIGSDNDLSFSSQEVLNESIIGLDGVNRTILVLKRKPVGTFESLVIDLNKVKSCSVKKQYGTMNRVDKVKKTEPYLHTIILHFELMGNEEPIEILFYHSFDNHVSEIAELERKAKHWEAVLSKMRQKAKTSELGFLG